MEKDYSTAIVNGFATTGLYPLDPERLLRKLPADEIPPENSVEAELRNKLSNMRYNQGKPKRAARPTKKDKLPAGVSYTCRKSDGEEEDDPEVVDSSSDSRSGGEDSDSDSGSEDKQRSKNVKEIIKRLQKGEKRKTTEATEEEGEEEEENEEEGDDGLDADKKEYRPDIYVAAVYDDDWHVGQVLDKEVEPDADPDSSYVFLNFMQKGKALRWPEKLDTLNVLKTDILCPLKPPTLNFGGSSSRSVSFKLNAKDQKKVCTLFQNYKAYYLNTVLSVTDQIFWFW